MIEILRNKPKLFLKFIKDKKIYKAEKNNFGGVTTGWTDKLYGGTKDGKISYITRVIVDFRNGPKIEYLKPGSDVDSLSWFLEQKERFEAENPLVVQFLSRLQEPRFLRLAKNPDLTTEDIEKLLK